MITTSRPAADEYALSFAGYVALISEDEDILAALSAQLDEALTWLRTADARGDYRYAPGKWSIKEVVGHLSDTERVFACRALRIGRGDTTPLPAMDDQAYVRRGTVALFRNLPPAAWHRKGIAGDQPVSVRALAYVIAGHGRHHLEVLKARYTG